MSSNQPEHHLHKLLSKYDDFLSAELSRIRNLPENQPNERGECPELFYNLVAGLSKTKRLNFVQAVDTEGYFLERNAPEIPLQQSIDAGPAQMKRMQERMAAYVVNEEHSEMQVKKWWQFWRYP
jgi:hypothetical protein